MLCLREALSVSTETLVTSLPVPAVVFGRADMPFHAGDRLDAVFHFSRDNYGLPQFFVRDLRPAADPR